MELLQTIFYFLAALFVLVSVHEFGHFYAARLNGVKVLRFCIGMGTPLWSFRDKQGTQFGLAPFPLGGYVKMLDEREGNVPADERHLAFTSKSVWQRISILAAGPLANFLLAIAVFWTLIGFQGTQGVSPQIGRVDPGSLADTAGLEPGQRIVAVDGQATATRQDVREQLLRRLGESGTLTLSLAAGESDVTYETDIALDNWLRGAKDPDPEQGLGFSFTYPALVVADVQQDSAAQRAGLRKGDVLMSIDGQDSTDSRAWIDYIQSHPGQRLNFRVERGDQPVDLNVVPAETIGENGKPVGQIGVMFQFEAWPESMLIERHFGFWGSLKEGAVKSWNTAEMVFVSLKKLIVGEISTKNLSGPIGIAKVAGDRAQVGLIYFIEFLAVLSVYLGVLNLLPIPLLDGGHIMYCLIEAVKGSPVSEKIQMMGFSLGLVVLTGVMIVALYNDILRL